MFDIPWKQSSAVIHHNQDKRAGKLSRTNYLSLVSMQAVRLKKDTKVGDPQDERKRAANGQMELKIAQHINLNKRTNLEQNMGLLFVSKDSTLPGNL